jgi:hypothetical protein
MNPPSVAPIDCETAMRRLWDFLDEELASDCYEEVAAHVASCEGCASHVAFARTFLAIVQHAWRDQAPLCESETTSVAITTPASLKTRVVERLRQEGFQPMEQRP